MIKIEIVIRKKVIKGSIKKFFSVITEFKTFESEERCVLDINPDWVGFKDGTIYKMLKEFEDGIYIALAYFTNFDNEFAVDIDGNSVDKYEVVVDGLLMYKYVKKKLIIVKNLDKDNDKFEVKAYMINSDLMNPVIKILDVYSVGKESNVFLHNIIKIK